MSTPPLNMPPPPPKTRDPLCKKTVSNVAARHEEGCYKKTSSCMFLFAKGPSNDDVGEGVKGHRISGDTAGCWFQNQRFR